MQMIYNFSNPILATNDRIITWAVLGFEDDVLMCFLLLLFYHIWAWQSMECDHLNILSIPFQKQDRWNWPTYLWLWFYKCIQHRGKRRQTSQNKNFSVTYSFCYFKHILQVLDTSAIFVFLCVFIALKGQSFYNIAISDLEVILLLQCVSTQLAKRLGWRSKRK